MSLTPLPNPLPVNQTQVAGTAVDVNSGNKSAGTQRVVLATDQPALTTALPVSAASLPLPSGAATAAKQPALGTAGSAASDVITVQGIASGTAQPVSGTFWQTTQPVSAASLPLPTGAASAAKQPALGTAGTASADVLSVQGIASGTPMGVTRGEGYSATALTATGATAFPGTDVSAYSWVFVQITANSSGDTLTFKGGLDNTTFDNITLFPAGATQSQGVTSTTGTGSWSGYVPCQYFEIAHTGGNSITGTIFFKQTPGVSPALGVTAIISPATSSGNAAKSKYFTSAASNNATNLKASSGVIFACTGYNSTAALRYLKLYNKASAPAPGSDNALLVGVHALPGTSPFSIPCGPNGIGCSSGVAYATVTGASDTDNTSVGAGDLIVNLVYN